MKSSTSLRAHRIGRTAATVLAASLVATVVLPCAGFSAGAVAPTPGSTPPGSGKPPAPTSPAAPSAATFGIGPSDGRRIDGRSTLTFLASPGSSLTDRVAVVNLAAAPATLAIYAIYAADAVAGADGSIGYQPRAARRGDAAAWITPQTPGGRTTITLAPRQTRVVPLLIRVPVDASPGDHVAGVIASLTSKVRNKNGQLIDFDQRVAVRTSFRISGEVTARLAVEDVQADYANSLNPVGSGAVTVSYTVHNIGNVTLGARQRVSVSGLLGEEIAKGVADVPSLLPKASVRLSVTVPDVLPQLRLTGRVTLYPLVVKGETAPGLAKSFGATSTVWAVPWALLVILALLVAAAFAVRAWRRGEARSPSGRHHRRPVLS